MKTRLFGILFTAVVCLVNMAFAQRTISINVGADATYTIPNDNTAYAGVQSLGVTCDRWNNMTGANQTLATIKRSTDNNCGASVTVVQAQGAWGPTIADSSRINGHENRKLLGRYMDLSAANQYTVTISNIPFARYKVYVILSGDGGAYASMIVNGVNYCGSGNTTVPGTSTWGTRTYDWTWLQNNCGNSFLKEGVNYLAITNQAGTLTVKNAISSSRATLAGIQIEEIRPVTWSGLAADSNWNNSTNWWDWPVVGSNVWFVGTNRTTNVNNFNAGTVFSNITFASSPTFGNMNWTISGNSFNLSGNLALNTAQTVTMSTPMALQLSPTITVSNNGSMTLSGALSGTGFGVTKDGGGLAIFSAANTYNGPTLVTGGTLRVTSTLRNSSSFTASNGGTLEFGAVNIFVQDHGAAVSASRIISADAGTIYMNGAADTRIANVTLKNGSTWRTDRGLTAWDVLVANNASGVSTVLVSGAGASYFTGSGGIHLQGVQIFNIEDTTASESPDLIASAILATSGSAGGALGGIRKQGAGTLALLGENTFNGALIIESGAVFVGTNTTTGTLGTGPVTNNATLVFNRSNAMIVNNVLAGIGTINQVGTGTLTLGGDNSAFVGTLNMTNGTVVPKHVNAFGAGTVSLSAGSIDMRATGAIAPTQGITLSGTPTIRMAYNSAQVLTVVAATGTTTLNVDVLDITLAGVYKLLKTSSDLGVGAFSLQPVNNTPAGLTAVLTSDAAGIYLNVSVAPKALTWKELATGDWDEVASNWTTNGIGVAFANGDKVSLPNYSALDAAALTLKGNYTLTGLAVSGNETDYTVALDTGTALETRAFSKTGTGFFTFPGSLTVTPGSIQNVTGAMTIGTLTAPSLSLSSGASVTLTNDASRIQSATVAATATLTIPSAAVIPNNVTVTAGTYPNQAVVRLAGGSAPATTFPFTDKQATFRIEKEVNLGASGYNLGGNQTLVVGAGGSFSTTNDVFSCATARLILNDRGTLTTKLLAWGNTADGHTSTIVQDGGTIVVTGNVNADANTSSIMFAHYNSTANYTISGGSFVSENAQILMTLDGTATFNITNSALVRAKGIRVKSRTHTPTRNSTLNFNGGVTEIGSIGITSAYTAGTYVNLNGGKIRAIDNFPINLVTAPLTLVNGVMSDLDLNGKTVTMVSDFGGTGTLCITNAGRLVKSGAKVLNIPNLAFRDGAGLTFLMAEDLANSEKMITTNLTLVPSTTFTLDLNYIRLPLERYPLIEANNAINGDLTGVSVALINKHLVQGGVTATLEIADNKVYAVLSNIVVSRNLDWKDIASGIWEPNGNILTTPWATNGIDVAYIDNDDPTFGLLAGNSASTVTVAGILLPRHIAFTADTTAYTVTGSGVVTASTVTVTGKAPVVVNTPLSTTSLTLGLGSNVTLTNDATRIAQQVTLTTNTTLTVPSIALFSGMTLLTTDGLYPNQARLRFEGGSSAATALPYTDRRVEIVLAKAVELPASYWVSNGQTLRLGVGGSLTLSTGEFSVNEGRLLLEGGSLLTPRLLFANTGNCTSIVEQTSGAITVTGSNSTDNNQASVMLGHWSNPAYTTYNMSGGEFIAENAWVQMALDAVTTWTITNAALVRAQGIRMKTDADGRNSTLNLNGGTLEIGWRGISTAGPATSFFNLGGGTVKALTNFVINLSTAPINLVAGTTSVLDLNGYTLTNYSDFAGSGTLCITNSGRIARSGTPILAIPNLLFRGTAGLQMVLDETLLTSERITTGVLTLSDTPALMFTLDLQNKANILKRYPLINATSCSGSLANASVVLVNNANGLTASLELQGGKVFVVFSGGTLASDVYWKDLASGNWDTATKNWTTNGVDAQYDNNKAVVFGDLQNNSVSAVTVTEAVDPEAVAFVADKTAYTISGVNTIVTPTLNTFGTNTVTISAPLTVTAVQLDTGSKLAVNNASSLLVTSYLRPNATLSVVPSVLQAVPTGSGTLELLSGTYRFANANYNAGTVKVTDANTRAEYVYSAATPVAGISGAGTFAFVSTNSAIVSTVPGDPIITFPGFTGSMRLESLGQMRIGTANWRTTFQNMPSASTLFFGKGVQYMGAVFSLNAKMVFEDGAQLGDHFQDGAQTFGQFRFNAGPAYFSNTVHLGTNSYIRIGSDANATVWFKNAITGSGSTIEFGSGYTGYNATLQVELDCANSAETVKIRNSGGTGRVTVNAWGASSLGNNLKSETTGVSGSGACIVNIGDAATEVDAVLRTVTGSNADDVIALNHASGSLTIDGAAASTYNGKFTGIGRLIKAGNGTLTLAGNSTFAGGFILNAGTVVPKHANAFGSNPTLTLNGGTVDLTVSGAVPPAQTNITATGTPSIWMKYDSDSDMTINGISGTVVLAVDVAGAALNTEYKLLNSNQSLNPASFALSMLNKHAAVSKGELVFKADGVYLKLKGYGTMIQFQ
jgi:autotransporter-associated beta strand protein